MRALILSGGGARGAYEAGVAISLLEHERFDIVCGTSIGAINGALIAQGDIAELARMWSSIAATKLVRLAPEIAALAKAVGEIQKLSGEPLAQRATVLVQLYQDYAHRTPGTPLRKLPGALDSRPVTKALRQWLRFGWIKRTLIIGTTNLTQGRSESFYRFAGLNVEEQTAQYRAREPFSHPITEENYVAAVCASSAIPGAFAPVAIADGKDSPNQYVDGGVTGNAPISQAIAAGATDVTIIFMDRADLRPPNQRIESIADIGLAAHDIMQQSMLERDLKLARDVNRHVLEGQAPGKRFVEIRTITPQTPLGLSVLDFNKQERIDAAVEQGKRDGELAAQRGNVGRSPERSSLTPGE
jgi:predicted acylesterase/phospholipase RssA